MIFKYTVEELLLDESFADYCSNPDSIHKHKWEELMAHYPDQRKIMEEAKEWLDLLRPQLQEEEIAREVKKLQEILQAREQANGIHKTTDESWIRTRKRKIRRPLFYSSIAFVSILTAAYFLFQTQWEKAGKSQDSFVSLFNNEVSSRKQVVLPDGSIVILNSNSQVSISAGFNQKDRIVQLSGEAFFRVTKNTSMPFVVNHADFSAIALGTSFYVRAREDGTNYSVDLLEGKVKLTTLKGNKKPTYLKAGEQAEWQSSQSGFATHRFDTLELKQWLRGKISFNHTPAKQAIERLEEWYGTEIEVQRKDWENLLITGDYENAPLEDVLKVICFSLSGQYSKSGNKVIIQ